VNNEKYYIFRPFLILLSYTLDQNLLNMAGPQFRPDIELSSVSGTGLSSPTKTKRQNEKEARKRNKIMGIFQKVSL
jgi:hypothetical protein